MVSPQMPIARIEGTEARIRNFLKDVNAKATKIVRDTAGTIYVSVPSQELGWLDRVAKDIGVRKAEVQEFPRHDKALCGVFTTHLHQHVGRCKKCTALRPPKPHDGVCKTVVKVEGLHDLSLTGLVNLMKQKMDEALALAQEWDTAIKAVEKIPELQAQMESLSKQMVEHRQALKYFTEGR